ncbi:SH3 domain-containing protein [Nonomuraea sp. WAC 01424]|uniref:SH3 domain-containing protein n=1 Tax=Nonomuraea sp. WAC 01424 TaxID=2203200 RepID=UPI000F77BE37|nr:SH3 domain-containing protein [Nonomuraea sp. WAC 01424]
MNPRFLRPIVLVAALVTISPPAAPPALARRTAPVPTVSLLVAARTHAQGRVTAGRAALAVRVGPGAGFAVIRRCPPGSLVDLAREVRGGRVHGDPRWYRLADGPGFVPAYYVLSGTRLPGARTDAVPAKAVTAGKTSWRR